MDLRVIVAEMGAPLRLALPFFLLAACGDDPPFVSLSTLCADLAENICDARGSCCPGVDPTTCVTQATQSCETELSGFSMENNLEYSSRAAAQKLRASRAQLDACGAPPALASFFSGGLADGAACERNTQCSGGLCTADTHLCAPATPALCP